MNKAFDLKPGDKVFYGEIKNYKLNLGETTVVKVEENRLNKNFKFVYLDFTENIIFEARNNIQYEDSILNSQNMFTASILGSRWHAIASLNMENIKRYLKQCVENDMFYILHDIKNAEKSLNTLKKNKKTYKKIILKLENTI